MALGNWTPIATTLAHACRSATFGVAEIGSVLRLLAALYN
jgi:hypothetical protein